MKFEKLTELIDERITGEWGQEADFSGVNVIRTTNFTNDGKLDLSNVVKRNIEKKKIEKKSLKKGDIIIEKSGGGPTQPVGRVVYFDVESDGIFLCNNFTTILRPKLNLVNSKYLLYQMLYLHKSGRSKRYQNKTTGIHNLNLEKYLQEKIALPPLPDQLHIANILSKAENLIAQRKESIRLLDEFLKSTFFEMFGDPVRNEKGWVINTLDSVLDGIDNGWSPVCLNKPRNNEFEWAILKLGSVSYRRFNPDENKLLDQNIKINKELVPKKGDLLFSRKNTYGLVGASAYIFEDYDKLLLPDTIFKIKYQSDKVSGLFLCFLFNDLKFRNLIQSLASGTAGSMPNISKKKLSKLKIFLPPISLQTQFAQIVQRTEALRSQYQQSLQELENLYGSLSQKAFRGELRVNA
ncbi:MAG: restriction endonuclease subunit S [Bacteroidetes bacterium]|nr:restriction endonuclease subunit S [Bacteroidota bacterium]